MIGSAEEFRTLVDSEIADEPNPHIVAERVLDKISGDIDAMRIALNLSLSGWVATRAKRPPLARPDSTRAQYVDGEGRRRPSAKAAGLVDHYLRKLAASVNIGDGVWKKLGDCTVTDLHFLVQLRRGEAAANLEMAEKYQRLADALTKSQAATVATLPRKTGESILL